MYCQLYVCKHVIFKYYSLYSFDMRMLSAPVNIHMGHTSAVMDVDYAPTGREFVSGSYDKSIRIFEVDKGRSRYVRFVFVKLKTLKDAVIHLLFLLAGFFRFINHSAAITSIAP